MIYGKTLSENYKGSTLVFKVGFVFLFYLTDESERFRSKTKINSGYEVILLTLS